ncbi:MAG: hypothetical protein JJU46_09450 [Balneolaceae bacterium]|nr:hypothetical protein [Balneolaceae bacterium]MCH8548151.1 hypothetical protein [Balneolaceae bacterium]
MRSLYTLFPLLITLLLCTQLSAQDHLDHRDDFEMESMSGGDFRDYVSEYITEDSRWALLMVTLGNFHNLMHELMSHIARYGAEQDAYAGSVPDFELRISGGEWTEIREALEEEGVESEFSELVQIFEIMHDRVHHAMTKAVTFENQIQNRGVNIDDYTREANFSAERAIPDKDELRLNSVSAEMFRELVWHGDVEGDNWHAAMQSMVVFSHILYDLLTRWSAFGEELEEVACHPAEFGHSASDHSWSAYAEGIGKCSNEQLRDLVKIADLMKERIHHVMYTMVQLNDS